MITTQAHGTFGISVSKCMRYGALLGMVLSIFHVTIGSILVIFILQVSRAREDGDTNYQGTYEEFMLYKGNDTLLLILSVILIALNLNQIISDILIFNATLSGGRRKFLWFHFLLGVAVWIGSLVCFMLIFSAGGLILLTVCLAATAIRIYVLFLIHQFIGQQRKSNDMSKEGTSYIKPQHQPQPRQSPERLKY